MSEPSIRAQSLPLTIHAQYIRDLSFENPQVPESLRGAGSGAPSMDVNVSLDARPLKDDKISAFYEVSLRLSVKATREQKTVFVIDLDYGVAVSLSGVPEAQHHPVLLVEVPRLAFPFVRQIVAEVVQQGGFPPLLLTPVDFSALYVQQFGDKAGAAKVAQA